jgi:competence protein ComEC
MIVNFHRVALPSLILNLLAIPLVALIMAGGYILGLFIFIGNSIAQILSTCLTVLIKLLLYIAHLADYVPFLSFRIPTPHNLIIPIYFLLLLCFLIPRKFKGQKIANTGAFLAILVILILYPFPAHSKDLKLTFIDVGQGDSILLEFPGTQKMLIDGGGNPGNTYDIGENVVSPFLWSKGIKRIDYMVLSHAHPDHYNGLKAIARNFKIREFWEGFSPENNDSYQELLEDLSSEVVRRRIFRGETFSIGDVRLEILHPLQSNPIVPAAHNDQSLVIKFTYGKTSFLLTGDIEASAEQEILSRAKNLTSLVLKSPHHGSSSSSSSNFLQAISPEIIIISVGKRNRYNLPDPQVMKQYENLQADIYRTDLHGAVEIRTDGLKTWIRTVNSPE